jgi:hypothetical protein
MYLPAQFNPELCGGSVCALMAFLGLTRATRILNTLAGRESQLALTEPTQRPATPRLLEQRPFGPVSLTIS